ncbi:DNA-formamidopyrimidine glycosylase [Patescibacteria group bacterium]
MPELPEVQTIVDDLNRKIKGDKIINFESFWEKSIKNNSLNEFKKGIIGREILNAGRLGKNIFIILSGGKAIYIHLKMTGHLLVKEYREKNGDKVGYFDEKVNGYIRHIWTLENSDGNRKTLEFSDLRKFGKIMLVDTSKIDELPEISKLGVDVMDRRFTLEFFRNLLKKKQRSVIGNVLMDQSLISGIGNIYRSEILFESGINPKRKISELNDEEVEVIHENILKVIKKAIRYRGTSDSDYRDTSGAPGEMHKHLKVYNKEGEKCEKCDTMVKREKINQRSVFYCASCQK